MSDLKILIVEDEFLIAKGLSRKLTALGYNVVDIVASGAEAIACVENHHPHLVLMDIAIQGDMDGIETANQIHHLYNIPVVYVTAYADDQTLERAEATGSYGYILKPYKDRELHATIKLALKKHQEELQLQASLAAAKAINEEKSHYLSAASHDLRTPLTAIKMSADLLQHYSQKLTEEKKAKHLERIQDAVTNMNDLLEDILVLSKSQSGLFSLNLKSIDLIRFCLNLIEELKPLAKPEHHINFSCDHNQANLDERLLRQILENLLSNAIKYSPKGGEISLLVTANEHEIKFQVSDQGIGIPTEYYTKLFQEFERGSNVGDIKGTGLGLSIVKQAVELHKGQITVESSLEKGTIFTIILPNN